MEHDKLQKCEVLINEMMQFHDTKIEGVELCIQIEQAIQLKRVADALKSINAEVDRKARWRRPAGL